MFRPSAVGRVWVGGLAAGSLVVGLVAGVAPASAATTMPTRHSIWAVQVSADGTRLHLLGHATQSSKIDATTGAVQGYASIGNLGTGMVSGVTPMGERAYATYGAGDEGLAVIDADTWTVVADLPTDGRPSDLALAPDGETLYLAKLFGGGIDVLDTATNTVTAFFPFAGFVTAVAVSPDGTKLYATHVVADAAEPTPSVVVLDAQTGAIVGEVVLPYGGGATFTVDPTDVAMSPDGDRVYVTDRISNMVYGIDAATLSVVGEAPTGEDPVRVKVDPAGERAYVLDLIDGTLLEVDTASWTTRTYPVPPLSRDLAISQDGLTVYVGGTAVVTVLHRPDVDSITPAVGPLTGGSEVTLTGANLAGATSVIFGDAEASFTVDSPTQITAIKPAAAAAGPVPVQVTTLDGVSSSVTFTYQADKIATTMAADPVLQTLPNLVAHLTTASGGPVVGRTVTFTGKLLGITLPLCTATTGASGTATCAGGALGALLGYTASFAGDATYEPSSAVGTLM